MTAVPGWAIDAIVRAGRRMDARGWVPATAGNISVRLGDVALAVTRSGGHKGFLDADSVMAVDLEGMALTAGRPSAETLLHCQLYRLFPQTGAVLHGHSIAATVLTTIASGPLVFAGYEVQKAFAGQMTHEGTVTVPVVANDQDISRLAANVEPALLTGAPAGYLIRGHGAYVWGPDMDAALARLEALEFLLECELEKRKLAR